MFTLRRTVKILDIDFSNKTLKETVDLLENHIQNNKKLFHLITVNPEISIIAQSDDELLNIIKQADLITPDGFGIVLASKRKKEALPERVTGFDLLNQLLSKGNKHKWSFYFLGTDEDTNRIAVDRIKILYPNITVAGRHNGFFSVEEEKSIIDSIKEIKPDILIIAMGAPYTDKWIQKHKLEVSETKLVFGVGGSLDVLSGKTKETPLIWKKLNLEWLHRLLTAPVKMGQKSRWKRQLSTMPKFIYKAILRNPQ